MFCFEFLTERNECEREQWEGENGENFHSAGILGLPSFCCKRVGCAGFIYAFPTLQVHRCVLDEEGIIITFG